MMCCRVDEVLWFLFASCKSPALDAGHKRQARSYGFSDGPKLDRINRDTQQSAVSNDRTVRAQQWTQHNRLHCTRMRSRPNGHRNRHSIPVTSLSEIVYKNTTALSHSTSPYSTVRFRPAPPSIAGRLEHRNGSISAGTTRNRVIRVALASLRRLLSRGN